MGATHFLTQTKNKVSAEMSLYVLAYNIRRMIKTLGIKPLLKAIRAYGEALATSLVFVAPLIRQIRKVTAINTALPVSNPIGSI